MFKPTVKSILIITLICVSGNGFFAQKHDRNFLIQHSIDIHPNAIPFAEKGKWGVALFDGTVLVKPKYDSLLNAGTGLCIAYSSTGGKRSFKFF